MLFNFFNKKQPDDSVIGRNQQLLWVDRFLGEDINEMEFQIALNKDKVDYNEIKQDVEELKNHIKSEDFTSQLDILEADKNASDILIRGYDLCVLQNDPDLELDLLEIIKNTTEIAKKKMQPNDKSIEKLDKELMYFKSIGFFRFLDLGGLLKTADQQMAWAIINQQVSDVILLIDEVEKYVQQLKEFTQKMIDLKKDKTDKSSSLELERLALVEGEISKGLALRTKNKA